MPKKIQPGSPLGTIDKNGKLVGDMSTFSKFMKVTKAVVTRWNREKRLVFLEPGIVDFEASKILVNKTASPTHRHQSHHATIDDDQPTPEGGSEALSYQDHRSKKEKYLALQAKLDYEKAEGKLIPRVQVEQDWIAVAVVLRNALEAKRDIIAADLAAESSYDAVYSMLSEYDENVLKSASDEIRKKLCST